jgi:hypothetical protein
MIFFFLLVVGLIFLTFYIGYTYIFHPLNPIMKKKILGVLFIYFSVLGFSVIFAIPLIYVIFGI